MKELSEIIQELVDSSNSMTAIQYVVEAGMDKAKELIKDSGEL